MARPKVQLFALTIVVFLLLLVGIRTFIHPPAPLTVEEAGFVGTYAYSLVGQDAPVYSFKLHSDRTCSYDQVHSGVFFKCRNDAWSLQDGQLVITHRYPVRVALVPGGPSIHVFTRSITDNWQATASGDLGKFTLKAVSGVPDAQLIRDDNNGNQHLL